MATMDSRDLMALDTDLQETQTELAAWKANLIALEVIFREQNVSETQVAHIARPTPPDTTSSHEEAIENLKTQNQVLADEVEQLTAALKSTAAEKSSLLTKYEHRGEEMKRMQKRLDDKPNKSNQNGSITARTRLSSRGQLHNVPEANKVPNGEAKKLPRVPHLALGGAKNTTGRSQKNPPNSDSRPNSASFTSRAQLTRPSSAASRDRAPSTLVRCTSNLTAPTASSRARMTPRPVAPEGKLQNGSEKKIESTGSAQPSAEGMPKLRQKAPGSGIPVPGSSIPTATSRAATKKPTQVGSGLKAPGSWSAASVRKRDMKE